MRILLAVDGSDYSIKAARYLAAHFDFAGKANDLHVLYVHPRLPEGLALAQADKLAGKGDVNAFYRHGSHDVLAPVEEILRERGLSFESDYAVGDVAGEIHDYVSKNRIDMIVMGSHGHGALASAILGSATAKVLSSIDIPVLVIR